MSDDQIPVQVGSAPAEIGPEDIIDPARIHEKVLEAELRHLIDAVKRAEG